MKRIHFILIALLLIAPPLARTADRPESVLIGPGDLLHIQVFQTPDMEQHARVSDSGTVELLTGDAIAVKDMTPTEAAHLIEKALISRNWMLSPHVTVTIEQYATQGVTVLGQVKNPGEFKIETTRSLLDVLSLAGGLNEFAGHQVTIKRGNTQTNVSYFVANDARDEVEPVPLVYPGDAVIVPRAETVYVLGDVGHPGAYVNAADDGRLTVLRVIAQAGSTLPHAVPSKAIIIRRKEDATYARIPLPLSAMQKGKAPDMALKANDVIYVPFSYLRNMAVDLGGLVAAAGTSVAYVAR
jgi:polysaccharide biosynthesis/export protein